MPLPTTYTREGLAEWLYSRMIDTMNLLGWTAASDQVLHAVDMAIRSDGKNDIAGVTDVGRLELLAIREMWSVIAGNLAARHDYETGDEKYQMEKLYSHAMSELQRSADQIREYDLNKPSDETGATAAAGYVTGYNVLTPRQARRRAGMGYGW